MAIKLSDKPNTEPAGGDYIYGNIKDDTGSGDGTPVSRIVYSDFHQFFERLMAIAGISHNGQPDNATTGFQLVDALIKATGSGAWTNIGAPTLTTDTGTATVFNAIYNRYKIAGKTLHWHFAVSMTIAGSPSRIEVALPSWTYNGVAVTPVTTISGANSTIGLYRGGEPLVCSMNSTKMNLLRADTGSGAPPFSNQTGHLFAFKISFEIQ